MTDVTIYTRMGCGYCARAKRLLESKGVEYTEHDASFSPELRQEMIQRSNGGNTFPQIFIGDTHVGGCDELFALEQANKLDPMLKGSAD
ncbi:glutaredoxin 3 [Nitratireductor basaltis]|uniref:Glutaredoxin n=1 Tax=Nitratireductor basaltis TaxID=472175 RepID=A0A084U7N9_9HYPH|nr:glutaredoxin 3 [Nitratireductor basaltis]KFB08975.1 Glutaredoxin 3 [Nitratireductor basaltis]